MKPVTPKLRAVLQDLVEAKGFFSRQMPTYSRISTIERIAKSGEVAAIPCLTPLLADNVAVASAASRGIAHLLRCAGADDFLEIDVQVRHWTGHDIYQSWRNLRPNDIWRIDVDGETRTAVLSVLSCHPDGHVREAAVTQLKGSVSDIAVAFQLVRLNDWVEPVRTAARSNLLALLAKQEYSPFFTHLPLVVRLNDCGRDDHSAIVSTVLNALIDSAPASLSAALSSSTRNSRRKTYIGAMSIEGEHRNRVMETSLASADPVLRLWAIRDARNILYIERLHDALLTALADSFVPVRREAILAILERFPNEAETTLKRMLLDCSASIRELARFYLKKIKQHDFGSIYREALATHPSREAIAGVGETGSTQDAQLLIKFATSPLVSMRRAAIRAIGVLDAHGNKELLLAAVRDGSAKVSHVAAAALNGLASAADLERLAKVFREDTAAHVRMSVVQLLGKQPFWDALPHLILAAANSEPVIAGAAEWQILSRVNHIYTPKLKTGGGDSSGN